MREPSNLAEELWSLFNPPDSMNHDYEKAGRWVIRNYTRIFEALRDADEYAKAHKSRREMRESLVNSLRAAHENIEILESQLAQRERSERNK